MFSFLRGSSQKPFPDKIWKTRAVAWKQAATEALRILTISETPLIIFFFEEELREFEDLLTSLKVPFSRMDANAIVNNSASIVFTANAMSIESDVVLDLLLTRSKVSKLSFLFMGHYPLPDRENILLEKISAKLGAGFSMSCWMSFEDPLLRTFGSEQMLTLMEKLGLKDDECMEHAMISKSITRAREKIASHMKTEINTTSEVEWFARNVRKV
jgi:hypothetical protein